jgi:hypothetical protein
MKWPWNVPRETDGPLFARPDINTSDRKALGESAERLLSSDIFLHSVERVVDNLTAEWLETHDPAKREELWRTQKALALVRAELGVIVQEAVADIAVDDGEDRLTAIG